MLVAECIGDLSPVFLAVAVELILPAAGIVEGLVDRADLRVRQGGPEIVENLLRDLRVGDEETLEVLQLEEGGEDYLGFNIGFECPEGSTPQKTEPAVILPSIPIVSVEQVSLEVTPQEYFKPDIRRFSIDDPAPFRLSVDVLNYGLREEYLGKHYGAWMKGAFEFTANNTAYMIWFPKLSTDGKPASSSGWINTTVDDGRTIIEQAAESEPKLGYEVADSIRLVFTKTKNIWQEYLDLVEQLRKTERGKEIYAMRKETIERVFADAKEKHAMRYTHHRGLAYVTNWVKLKYAAMNLKKLANWSWNSSKYSPFFQILRHNMQRTPFFA